MMNAKLLFCFFFFLGSCFLDGKESDSKIVLETNQIKIDGYPKAFNPSIIEWGERYLLSFRYCLWPESPSVSYIGFVWLNKEFEIVSAPQILSPRAEEEATLSHAEDARLLIYKNEPYVLYNDNNDTNNFPLKRRRDMFIAKVLVDGDQLSLAPATKLFFPQVYESVKVQKNWGAFVWQDILLLEYYLNPHEVLYPNLETGECSLLFKTGFRPTWRWGGWRGGTPALFIDGEYLAFFHSSIITRSDASQNISMHHYYMGAYTFAKDPPFALKSASVGPIVGENFYTVSSASKRVIFPGGFVVKGRHIYVVYGKDDREVWVTKLHKEKLKKSLKSVRGL